MHLSERFLFLWVATAILAKKCLVGILCKLGNFFVCLCVINLN